MASNNIQFSYNCVYINCTSNVSRNKDLRFFPFPIKNPHRLEKWRNNCGNKNIAIMNATELKTKLLCELHFPSKYIVQNLNRTALTKWAVPDKYNVTQNPQAPIKSIEDENLTVGQHSKSYCRKRVSTANMDTNVEQSRLLYVDYVSDNLKSVSYSKSDHISKMELPTKYLPQKIKTAASKRIHAKKKTYKRNKYKFCVTTELMNLLARRSKFVRIFINMQLFHKRNKEWSKSERDIALTLYLKSPYVYEFMLHTLQFTLPSEEVVQGWLKTSYLEPGLNKDFMHKLSIRARTMTRQEKMIAVMMDEIRLTPWLEFNSSHDKIEGFEDFDGARKSSKIADIALVFSVSNIYHNWKMPLAFYTFSKTIYSVSLQKIVIDIIKKLKHMTFDPLVLVCNQEPNKIRMLELLGATQANPVVDIEGQRVFTCFNTSHLLNSWKNIFMDAELNVFIKKMRISSADIMKIYGIDGLKNVQGFSKTSSTRKIRTPEYTEFLDNIKCIVVVLKRQILHFFDSEKKDPSTCYKLTVDNLQKAFEYFKDMEIFEDNKLRDDIICIQGILWTINCILLLWDYVKNIGSEYLLTNFTNLDDLERFLSKARNLGEFNAPPTFTQLRNTIQHIIDTEIQKDIKKYILQNKSAAVNITRVFVEKNGECRKEPQIVIEDRFSTCRKNLNTNPMVYVAGYLAHKLKTKYRCVDCVVNLIKNEERLPNDDELSFILSKNYCCDVKHIKHLPAPSDEFSDVVITLLQVFEEAYDYYKCDENVSKNVYTCLRAYLSRNSSWWSQIEQLEQCAEHLQFVLRLFVEMNVIKFVNVETKNYNATAELMKPCKKIRVLQAELF